MSFSYKIFADQPLPTLAKSLSSTPFCNSKNMDEKEKKENRVKEIEAAINGADFWADKAKAQALIKELQELKVEVEGGGKYDSGGAVVTIFSGAGGDDSEDFSAMLFGMYRKFIEKRGWSFAIIHQNQNDHGGFRNLTFEIQGHPPTGGVYGTLKNESGVHRLVRISPFNAQKKRHTSFSMLEVIPKLPLPDKHFEIPESELELTTAS